MNQSSSAGQGQRTDIGAKKAELKESPTRGFIVSDRLRESDTDVPIRSDIEADLLERQRQPQPASFDIGFFQGPELEESERMMSFWQALHHAQLILRASVSREFGDRRSPVDTLNINAYVPTPCDGANDEPARMRNIESQAHHPEAGRNFWAAVGVSYETPSRRLNGFKKREHRPNKNTRDYIHIPVMREHETAAALQFRFRKKSETPRIIKQTPINIHRLAAP